MGWAASNAHAGKFLPHKPHLTVKEKIAYFERSIRHDRQVIAWYLTPQAPRTLERVSEMGWYLKTLAWHQRLLARYRAKLPSSWPPHHALWLCIHAGEAGWHQASHAVDSHGVPLYWGGLQMHADWGYGTSHHASDDSQLEQEWAAERSLRAAGRNVSGWLWSQWAADARCF